MSRAAGAAPVGALMAPGLARRLACFVYEGVLLFGVVMIAAYLYSSLTQQRHAMTGRHGLQAFVFVVLGQTVAMKAWHVRLVTASGTAVSQGRALVRYLLSWLWFAPALVAAGVSGLHSGLAITGLLLAGVLVYAALSRLHPERQFLHDAICGTRLVDSPPRRAA
jgi:uncharacterized RDD family membrane protein YckC